MTHRKSHNLALIISIAVAISTVSCEKSIDFDGDEQTPQVVVSAEPEADSTVSLRLTYSRFFLSGTRFRTIDNATVTIDVNGYSHIGTYADGVYDFDYIATEGDSLALRIVLGDTIVSASTVVPHRPQIIAKESSGENIRFSLIDRSSEGNYYRMQLFAYDTIYTSLYGYDHYGNPIGPDGQLSTAVIDTTVDLYQTWFNCNDALLTDNTSTMSTDIYGDEESYYSLFFTDELFNGQEHEISIHKSTYEESNRLYIIEITAMPRETYLYELSLQRQGSEDFFLTEPVQIQCNIDGGLGIFGAKATTRLPIVINNRSNQ